MWGVGGWGAKTEGVRGGQSEKKESGVDAETVRMISECAEE